MKQPTTTLRPRATAASKFATVEFAEKQSGPVDVDLSTEQPLGEIGTDRAMELTGFEVLGAVRQYGSLAVHVADNWQLRWEASGNVRQVERADQPANLQQQPPTATFEYDRQPWSLHARLEPRPLRVHVTPEYNLELGPDDAQLHVRLNYQLPGACAFEFRVQLHGWELTPDAVESGGLVDQDRIVVSREGILILPLGQAPSRRAEITFSLRRSMPRDTTRLELPLPMPEADSVGAADLTVRTSADVELMPDLCASDRHFCHARDRGLTAAHVRRWPPGVSLPLVASRCDIRRDTHDSTPRDHLRRDHADDGRPQRDSYHANNLHLGALSAARTTDTRSARTMDDRGRPNRDRAV